MSLWRSHVFLRLGQLYAAKEQAISIEASTVGVLKTIVAALPAEFKDAKVNDIVNEILALAE